MLSSVIEERDKRIYPGERANHGDKIWVLVCEDVPI